MPAQLPNYIRTYRKRARLTQEDVAFIIGSRSGAGISRHERFKRTPDLETSLAYEMLFRTPVRNLYDGTHQKVERKLLRRIRLLIRKLRATGHSPKAQRKVEILTAYLEERTTAQA